jgi:hypothetical protein
MVAVAEAMNSIDDSRVSQIGLSTAATLALPVAGKVFLLSCFTGLAMWRCYGMLLPVMQLLMQLFLFFFGQVWLCGDKAK